MKRALFSACFLIACGGETEPAAVSDPAPAVATQTSAVDIDAYCAEKTNVPTRGAIQGDDYFYTAGAIDITSEVAAHSLSIHLRWPSKLTTQPRTGAKMRSDRYSYMTIDFDGELATGTTMPTRFAQGGGGHDCTAHGGQGGDAAGGTPIASTLTVTTRTDQLIEGTLEVPTDSGVQHLTFHAPIVPPQPAPTIAVCCLKE
jgi:hypothetical protein